MVTASRKLYFTSPVSSINSSPLKKWIFLDTVRLDEFFKHRAMDDHAPLSQAAITDLTYSFALVRQKLEKDYDFPRTTA